MCTQPDIFNSFKQKNELFLQYCFDGESLNLHVMENLKFPHPILLIGVTDKICFFAFVVLYCTLCLLIVGAS